MSQRQSNDLEIADRARLFRDVKAIGGAVIGSFGPAGLDDMLVASIERAHDRASDHPFGGQDYDDFEVTAQGHDILRKREFQTPTFEFFRDVGHCCGDAKEYVDGSTRTVLLATSLLKRAESLMDRGMLPGTIIEGYHIAGERCLERMDAFVESEFGLEDVVRTALTGYLGRHHSDEAVPLLVAALDPIDSPIEVINLDVRSLSNEELRSPVDRFQGEILHRNRFEGIPVEGADLTLLTVGGHNVKIGYDQRIPAREDRPINYQLDSIDGIVELEDDERRAATSLAQLYDDFGIDLVLCQRGIEQPFLTAFEQAGIGAIQNVSSRRLARVARATGARIVSDYRSVEPDEFGTARRVTERPIDDRTGIFIEGTTGNVSTICTDSVVRDYESELQSALWSGIVVMDDEPHRVVPGGGATELALSRLLRDDATEFADRRQLVFEAAAESLETPIRVLTQTCDMDPHAVIPDARAMALDGQLAGIDVVDRAVVPAAEAGILDAYQVTRHAVATAFELAVTILRIDGVLATTDENGNDE